MEDLMYQLNWLSNQASQDNFFDPSADLLKLFEIEAYRSWAATELEAQQSMVQAEEETDSAMAEFHTFVEELEREAMAEYHSLVDTAEAARRMGITVEKAATAASKKYIEAAVTSATNSMRSAWKAISSRKVHPS